LKKEEGGRHTPFFTGYKPQFYVRTTDVTGEVTLKEGVEMVMPGDTVTFKVKLVAPVALEEKQRFAIREGGKTVGAGVVTKLLPNYYYLSTTSTIMSEAKAKKQKKLLNQSPKAAKTSAKLQLPKKTLFNACAFEFERMNIKYSMCR
jgi:hypothetical protein